MAEFDSSSRAAWSSTARAAALPRRRRHRDGRIVDDRPHARAGARTVLDAAGCTSRRASSTSTPTTTPRSSGTRTARSRAGTASRRWPSATAGSASRRSRPSARARHAVDDPGRGDPLRVDAGRPAVGLGDVPRVPRQRGAHPKAVNVLPYVPLAPLLVWVLGLDDAKAGARRPTTSTRELGRLLARGDGRRRLRLVGAAARPRRPAGVQRDCDGTPMPTDVMHDETCRALGARARRAQQGFIQMTLITGDPEHDLGALRGAGRDQRPAGALQRGAGLRRRPTCTASSSSGWSGAASAACPCTARASPPTPASRSRSRTGTCSTTRRVVRGHDRDVGERLAKLADPAAAGALRDNLRGWPRRLRTIPCPSASRARDRAVRE